MERPISDLNMICLLPLPDVCIVVTMQETLEFGGYRTAINNPESLA